METTDEVMRFFTRAWHNGELPDQEYDATIEAYDEHLKAIAPELSAPLRRLTAISLHDAQVQSATVTRTGDFVLLLRAGDLQLGYFDITLRYENVLSLTVLPSTSVLDDISAEVISDEIDAACGWYEHRFILDPQGEISVRFSNMDYIQVPVPNRTLARRSPVFVKE